MFVVPFRASAGGSGLRQHKEWHFLRCRRERIPNPSTKSFRYCKARRLTNPRREDFLLKCSSSNIDDEILSYFAYGANVNSGVLGKRKLQFLSDKLRYGVPAALRGFSIQFNTRGLSENFEPAFANVVPGLPPEQVHGLVLGLTSAQVELLDAEEMRGRVYDHLPVQVHPYKGGDVIDAFTYVALPAAQVTGRRPSRRYLEVILEGARTWGLSTEYINALRETPCSASPAAFVTGHFEKDLPLMTREELRMYDGSEPGRPLYVSVNGVVYDVTANASYYLAEERRHLPGTEIHDFLLSGWYHPQEDSSLREETSAGWSAFFSSKFQPIAKLV